MQNTDKLIEIISRVHWWDEEENGYFTYYIQPTGYDDYISDENCAKILKSDNPQNALEDYFDDCSFDLICEYYIPELWKELKNDSEFIELFTNENEDEIHDFICDHVLFIMRSEDWNREICLNIGIDTGDANYDYTKNNILNYCGDEEIEDESSILWLCKQQGREQDFRKTIETYENYCQELDKRTEAKRIEKANINCYIGLLYEQEQKRKHLNKICNEINEIEKEVDIEFGHDDFIQSVIDELRNLSSHIGMLTFCVKTTLLDMVKIKQADKIIISKEATCGLFDFWNGGGSLLDIALEKDVEIPNENIGRLWVDVSCSSKYDNIHNVYGVYDDMWKGEIKVA